MSQKSLKPYFRPFVIILFLFQVLAIIVLVFKPVNNNPTAQRELNNKPRQSLNVGKSANKYVLKSGPKRVLIYNFYLSTQVNNQKTGGPLGEFIIFRSLQEALLNIEDVEVTYVGSEKEANDLLEKQTFDMIYLEKVGASGVRKHIENVKVSHFYVLITVSVALGLLNSGVLLTNKLRMLKDFMSNNIIHHTITFIITFWDMWYILFL
jgi:hypothetical protein